MMEPVWQQSTFFSCVWEVVEKKAYLTSYFIYRWFLVIEVNAECFVTLTQINACIHALLGNFYVVYLIYHNLCFQNERYRGQVELLLEIHRMNERRIFIEFTKFYVSKLKDFIFNLNLSLRCFIFPLIIVCVVLSCK